MAILYSIGGLLLVFGIIFIVGINGEEVSNDILSITASKMDLRKKVIALHTGKNRKTLGQHIHYLYENLAAMGKTSNFTIVCCSTLVLFAAGVIVAALIHNYWLVPAFAIGFSCIPYLMVKSSMEAYKKHISEELETTLSIVTTSYLRCDDIIEAVKENIDYIKPPLKEHFMAFINDATYVTSTEQALINLRDKVDNAIYWEWCESLIQCQSDRVLKDTLQPIVNRLTDVRVVNGEISAMLASCRMEYYSMVAMLVGSIPLLYVLNKDWYDTLVHSTPGQATMGFCAIVILITYLFLLKFTEPIEYKA